MKYKRILLKLSGESLMGEKQFGIDNLRLNIYASQIKEIHDLGIEVAIVIGGGNIFRGVQAEEGGMDRTHGDDHRCLIRRKATQLGCASYPSCRDHRDPRGRRGRPQCPSLALARVCHGCRV